MINSLKSLRKTLKFAPANARVDYNEMTAEAITTGLFNPEWYQQQYGRRFSSNVDAFKDYVHKSRFAPVNPSPAFDNEAYHRAYMDVFHGQVSPLLHYLRHGREEGRSYSAFHPRWQPGSVLAPAREVGERGSELKVAACLHIFYDDFIDRFSRALDAFPIELDLLLTLAKEEFSERARRVFERHPKVRHLEIRVVPNRGRNFGPMLVEYAEMLQQYDLFCHLHSKKSLYSGKEQTQWADYLTEYLLRDPAVVSGVLNLFAEEKDIGIYYPTTFWMMPTWVNHLTMNAAPIREWEEQLGLPQTGGFLSYPAGGMFWARPKALKELLETKWQYEDFPAEPLPNDGSMLHALERVIGKLAEKNGYAECFYYPPTGQFTTDQSYAFSSYKGGGIDQHLPAIRAHEVISFDVFDTLVRREYTVPDYAKLKLGQQLAEAEKVESAEAFVKLRNAAEFTLRKKAQFKGDVSITDIYTELAKQLGATDQEGQRWMQQEFELDLKMILPKNEMVELFNNLGSLGHKLWVISDTYYTRGQVGLMLKKAGITVPYRLLVSSAEQKRKDNGTMWHMVKQDLAEGITRFLHIGDNVVADAQLPGDLGLTTFHILHPMDKWQALGFPTVLQGANALDEGQILKWGKLVSQVGRNPFIGE
ncbi:rhamnan synthesis F family protein [Halomonas piscis]|uniref:rhamnan synthesis F family protein n=1 Tax=Halomonas piscis TaxID=3031727 RepID=UPI002899FE92|nr:rhamnan synthesis F family protein [Halomonas piscis]